MSESPTWFLQPPECSPHPDAVRRMRLAQNRGFHACISTTGYSCMVWVPTDTVSGGHWRTWVPDEERKPKQDILKMLEAER